MNEGRTFKHTVRVPYAHTDQMRYVYYANYLVYFEMARSEMLREVGLPYGELEKQGILVAVRKEMGADIQAACGQLRNQARAAVVAVAEE